MMHGGRNWKLTVLGNLELFFLPFCGVTASAVLFFFFQAEDGIRDPLVTEVQTCALPISVQPNAVWMMSCSPASVVVAGRRRRRQIGGCAPRRPIFTWYTASLAETRAPPSDDPLAFGLPAPFLVCRRAGGRPSASSVRR